MQIKFLLISIRMKKLLHITLLVLLACPVPLLSCGSSSAPKTESVGAAEEVSTNSLANDSIATFTVKGITFNMILVKGGTFTMGATPEQGKDAAKGEKPAHQVTLSDYYIGETEVTQALYEAVIGENPSDKKGADLPVESVNGGDCYFFAEKLSELTGRKFRLPTEAEWEFAARGGNKSKGYKYAGSNNLSDVAWFNDMENKEQPVKGKAPNELGIYDMSGNVDEYCADDIARYSKESQTNPLVESEDSEGQVIRGGSFADDDGKTCRVSSRSFTNGYVFGSLGFRIAMSAE